MVVTNTIECPRGPRRPPILIESVPRAGVAEPAGQRIDANAAGIRPGPGYRRASTDGSLAGALGGRGPRSCCPGWAWRRRTAGWPGTPPTRPRSSP